MFNINLVNNIIKLETTTNKFTDKLVELEVSFAFSVSQLWIGETFSVTHSTFLVALDIAVVNELALSGYFSANSFS